MKRQILFLSIITFFALSALAQTPYDNFAPEQSVKSVIEMHIALSLIKTPCL